MRGSSVATSSSVFVPRIHRRGYIRMSETAGAAHFAANPPSSSGAKIPPGSWEAKCLSSVGRAEPILDRHCRRIRCPRCGRMIGRWGRTVVRTRLLTVAGELSAIGGTEVAQLRIMEGLASMQWDIELLYVRRGDLWPRWNQLARSTRAIRSSSCGETPLSAAASGPSVRRSASCAVMSRSPTCTHRAICRAVSSPHG